MICYKDKTFCDKYQECLNGRYCDRALTPEVRSSAAIWWESFNSDHSAPISVFAGAPDCFEEIKKCSNPDCYVDDGETCAIGHVNLTDCEHYERK